MLKPLDIDQYAKPVVDVYNGLESALMQSIARMLKDHGNEPIETAKWQIQKLVEMGRLTKENMRIIADAVGNVPEMTMVALENAAREAIKDIEPDLQDAAEQNLVRTAPEVNASTAVKNVVSSYNRQAMDKLNLTNTTMLHQSEQMYRDIINKTVFATTSGSISRQEAMKRTIEEFADKGLPALVDRAGRTWTPEAYTSMVIKTTIHNTALASTDARMEDYGVNVFEVSTVAGARPLCAPYQGKLFSNDSSGAIEDLDGNEVHYGNLQDTSYGEPAGLFGINCHHTKNPFIPGLSRRAYKSTQNEEENKRQYAESQQQRQIERDIRKAKRKADMLKAAGIDNSDALQKVKAQQARMRQFIDDTGRTRRPDRERVILKK